MDLTPAADSARVERRRRVRDHCCLCWRCGLRPGWMRGRNPFVCRCRSVWKFGGPPADLVGNPLGLLEPPEMNL